MDFIMKKIFIALIISCVMTTGQSFATSVDQSYIFSNTASQSLDLVVLDTAEMQETKGEFVLLSTIIAIIGVDLALQAYYFGVYVPAIEQYRQQQIRRDVNMRRENP
jgi:hypothetical protein